MNLKLKRPLAVFDLETTGINVIKDRIVEISILKVLPDGSQKIRTQRINPTIPIPLESSLIHGIYDEDVKDAPHFKQIAKDTAEFLADANLCGFNILRFDLPLLIEEFLRVGVAFNLEKRKFVDVQKIFHLMEPRTLSAAYKFYCHKELTEAHSAEADTKATFEVLKEQIKRYKNVEIKNKKGEKVIPVKENIEDLHNISSSKMVDLAGRMIYNDQGEVVFNFGKYKGKPVLQVLDENPGYYGWIQANEFPQNTKNKLTEIRLRKISG